MKYDPVEIDIRWRCTHCGHRYEQAVAVCMPNSSPTSEPKLVGSGSLICQHCGQLGPIQVGCAIVLGLSVMAGSDGAVHVPLPVRNQPEADRWIREARHNSRN